METCTAKSIATGRHKGAVVKCFNDWAPHSNATQVVFFFWKSVKGSSERQWDEIKKAAFCPTLLSIHSGSVSWRHLWPFGSSVSVNAERVFVLTEADGSSQHEGLSVLEVLSLEKQPKFFGYWYRMDEQGMCQCVCQY